MLKWLLRLGISRGLMGGSRVFAALGTAAAVARLLQRLAGGGAKTLYTHKLEPGQVLVISDTPKPS